MTDDSSTVILKKLAAIADAYDENGLDDEARRFWGPDGNETENSTPKHKIILYQGRGGRTLLTLQDCFDARDVLKRTTPDEPLVESDEYFSAYMSKQLNWMFSPDPSSVEAPIAALIRLDDLSEYKYPGYERTKISVEGTKFSVTFPENRGGPFEANKLGIAIFRGPVIAFSLIGMVGSTIVNRSNSISVSGASQKLL